MKKFQVKPPIAQSAMSGYSTPQFCQKMLSYGVGLALLGAYAIDNKMSQASLQILKRGRLEFILPDNEDDLDRWLKDRFPLIKKESTQLLGVNFRLVEPDETSLKRIKMFLPYIDVIELNAHCRQHEVIVAGGGQALLTNLEKFEKIIQFLKENFSTKYIGVKIRGLALKDVERFCQIVNNNKVDFIHVDCMVVGKNKAEVEYIKKIHEKTPVTIIGNNSVRTIDDIKRMFAAGAEVVSIARPLIKEPEFIKELIKRWRTFEIKHKLNSGETS